MLQGSDPFATNASSETLAEDASMVTPPSTGRGGHSMEVDTVVAVSGRLLQSEQSLMVEMVLQKERKHILFGNNN